MAANARGSATHTATRRRTYQDGALRPEWQCRLRGTARSGPSGSADHTATRHRAYRQHALTLPLDVERTKTVRPGPSGSVLHTELHAQGRVAVPTTLPLDVERTGSTPSHCHSTSSVPAARPHTATRRRAYRQHALTLPLDVERTETVRPGPSGSVLHTELHAQGRVAVPTTLPLDVERTGSTPSHCHSTSNVPKMSRWLPMTSRTRRRWPSRARCPVTPASRGP